MLAYFCSQMQLEEQLKSGIAQAISELYGEQMPEIKLEITNKDFEGDYTFVVFPLLRASKKKPEETATELGEKLMALGAPITSFNVVKGFLNLVLKSEIWTSFLTQSWNDEAFGQQSSKGSKVMVEYSSPNTNKPLHLGHIRNNLLGYAVSEIMAANGYEVIKANLINDRGIHICKSMLAWQKWGNNETPESTGLKGDHLVGKYYVAFDKHYKEEIQQLVASGVEEEKAAKEAPLLKEAQEMLRKWEAGDAEVLDLWRTMNSWVYQGFEASYSRLGVKFDRFYYESDTYKLGRDLITEGLEKGEIGRAHV